MAEDELQQQNEEILATGDAPDRRMGACTDELRTSNEQLRGQRDVHKKQNNFFKCCFFSFLWMSLYLINQPEKGKVKVSNNKVLKKERNREFELSRTDRFRYRTRYFSDSGIIGLKEFVAGNYKQFKHLFYSKHEKKPKPIKGLEGIYSLKRLSEIISDQL